jgi:hypothetical protein
LIANLKKCLNIKPWALEEACDVQEAKFRNIIGTAGGILTANG